MLATVVCGVLCGLTNLSAIVQWLHAQPPRFWHLLGFKWTPASETTFRTLLAQVAPEAFERALCGWLPPAPAAAADEPAGLSVDGKRLCGTLSRIAAALHAVNVWDHRTGCVLRQQLTGDTNEAKTAVEIFRGLLLEGRIVVGDAAFCQQEVCQQILDSGGDYLLVVKDNQPRLHQDAQSAFRDSKGFSPYRLKQRQARRRQAESLSKGHGRIERRTLTVSTVQGLGLRGWPGLQQVLRLERVVTSGDQETRTVSYAVTSVSVGRLTARQLLQLWRDHWGIENSCFYVRDVTLGEDRCRVRTGHAGLNLAHVRNFALSVVQRLGAANVAAQLRQHLFHPTVLLKRLIRPEFMLT